MEKEKLEQAKKTFAEDSDKFHKYKKDLRDTTKDVQQEYEKAVAEKNQKEAEMKQLKGEIASIEQETARMKDNLSLYYLRKAFLDELAVSAGKKSLNPQKSSNGILTNQGTQKNLIQKKGAAQKKKAA